MILHSLARSTLLACCGERRPATSWARFLNIRPMRPRSDTEGRRGYEQLPGPGRKGARDAMRGSRPERPSDRSEPARPSARESHETLLRGLRNGSFPRLRSMRPRRSSTKLCTPANARGHRTARSSAACRHFDRRGSCHARRQFGVKALLSRTRGCRYALSVPRRSASIAMSTTENPLRSPQKRSRTCHPRRPRPHLRQLENCRHRSRATRPPLALPAKRTAPAAAAAGRYRPARATLGGSFRADVPALGRGHSGARESYAACVASTRGDPSAPRDLPHERVLKGIRRGEGVDLMEPFGPKSTPGPSSPRL